MQKLLRELIDQIYKFDNALEQKTLTKQDIEEEEDNLRDILRTKIELEKLLLELKKYPKGGLERDNQALMQLHILLDNCSWYFQNIHTRLMDIFKNYPQIKK